jgi:parallel beta-helix repeat protein
MFMECMKSLLSRVLASPISDPVLRQSAQYQDKRLPDARMGKYLKLLLLVFVCVSPFLAPLPGRCASAQPLVQISGGPYVDAGSYESVNAAVAAARGKTLLVSAPLKLSSSLLIPADVAVHMAKGGMLVKTSNYTITVQGPFTAGYYQIFDGFKQGEVTFRDGSVREVYPQWWGSNVSSSIQKALKSFNNVLIPKGEYLIDVEIQIPANTALKGEAGAVLKRPDNTVYPRSSMIVNEKFALDPPSYGDTGIVIDGITIDGNKRGGQNSHANGIYLRSATNVVIRNCTVLNSGKTVWNGMGHGIVFSNVKGGRIEGNVVNDNDSDGIVLYAKNSDIAVTSNNVSGNLIVGIEVEGRLNTDYTHYRNKAISITGNMVSGNGRAGHGILIDWSDSVSVQGNIVHDNTIWMGAINIIGCTDVTIMGNSVFNNLVTPSSPYPKAGITVNPHVYGSDGISRSVMIANNTINESYEGVSLKASMDSSITGNLIRTSAGTSTGIQIDGTNENIIINDNSIKPGAAGTGVALASGLNGALIDGNIVGGGSKGLVFATAAGTYSNINIAGNLFSGCAYGIWASPGVTIADGYLADNSFKKIGEKDVSAGPAAPVKLSSFFVRNNIHDNGIQSWDSAGSMPITGQWRAGDRVENMRPVEQGASPNKYVVTGWVCTASGSPGTWVEMRSPTGR